MIYQVANGTLELVGCRDGCGEFLQTLVKWGGHEIMASTDNRLPLSAHWENIAFVARHMGAELPSEWHPLRRRWLAVRG